VRLLLNFFYSSDVPTYIQTREPGDFTALSRVRFLDPDFSLEESYFQNLPAGSYVFLDDFSFKPNSKKTDFMWVVNFVLRHKKFSLFLIIHNMYGNKLFTEITLCPHIFLAYSALGYYALRWVTFLKDHGLHPIQSKCHQILSFLCHPPPPSSGF
jgi:hypothetical protein